MVFFFCSIKQTNWRFGTLYRDVDVENTILTKLSALAVYFQNVKNVFRLNFHRRGTKTKSHHGNHSQTLALVMRKANHCLDLPAKKGKKN